MDERFAKAVAITGEELLSKVKYVAHSWLPAKEFVQGALEARFKVDPSGKIVLFETYCAWKGHLYDVETELKIEDKPFYVVYSDGASWRVQAIPVSANSFERYLCCIAF